MSKKKSLKPTPDKSAEPTEQSYLHSKRISSVKANDDGGFSVDIHREVYESFKDSIDSDLMGHLLNDSLSASKIWNADGDIDTVIPIVNKNTAMFQSIAPRDGLEGMLTAQMIAVHNLSVEMAARVLLKDQSYEGVSENINRSTKLMRTFVAQMEALKKYRNSGKQTIQVQHVNVNEGGQAVVGNVEGGGGNG